MSNITNNIKWDHDGLIPAIAQDHKTGEVLMMAWMNSEALELTVKEQRAIYFSRSRQKIWRKGESSGHIQELKSIAIDCDNDVVLMQVEQLGDIACHTGRRSCFYREYQNGEWVTTADVLKNPDEIYQ